MISLSTCRFPATNLSSVIPGKPIKQMQKQMVLVMQFAIESMNVLFISAIERCPYAPGVPGCTWVP